MFVRLLMKPSVLLALGSDHGKYLWDLMKSAALLSVKSASLLGVKNNPKTALIDSILYTGSQAALFIRFDWMFQMIPKLDTSLITGLEVSEYFVVVPP